MKMGTKRKRRRRRRKYVEEGEKDHRGQGRYFGKEAIVEEIKMLEVTHTQENNGDTKKKKEKKTRKRNPQPEEKKIRIPSKRTTRKKTQDLCQTASYERKHRTLQPRLGLVSCKHIPMKVENITNSV